jgi:hypothetical protein
VGFTLEYEARMRIRRVLKGVSGKEVVVGTPGLFRKGDKYLVYARLHGGRLQSGPCSRTKLLKNAAGDFKEIEEGVEVKTEEGGIIRSLP